MLASYADKSPNAANSGNKASLGETKVLKFWDRIQLQGQNRVLAQTNYLSEVKELNGKFPGEAQKFIFSTPSDEYLAARKEINDFYEGKLVKDIVADNGDYIYTDEDEAEIASQKLV